MLDTVELHEYTRSTPGHTVPLVLGAGVTCVSVTIAARDENKMSLTVHDFDQLPVIIIN